MNGATNFKNGAQAKHNAVYEPLTDEAKQVWL